MSVNLQKGQKVELRKGGVGSAGGGELRRVMVGLGWDEVKQKRGFFAPKPQDIDCDASAFLCIDGRLRGRDDMVFYNNLTHKTGSVMHQGDNLTGAGEGDDEQILVDLTRLPQMYDKIVFVVTIYEASKRNQHFGMIQNAFIRICDAETGLELCKFNLSENFDSMTAVIFGELYRHNGVWKFNAIGQATRDDNVGMLAQRFT